MNLVTPILYSAIFLLAWRKIILQIRTFDEKQTINIGPCFYITGLRW